MSHWDILGVVGSSMVGSSQVATGQDASGRVRLDLVCMWFRGRVGSFWAGVRCADFLGNFGSEGF
eukprot:6672593-Karenia_brevis.AAC.1